MQLKGIKLLSDLTTPVSVFLKLREHYPEVVLLESSDYSGEKDSLSFVAIDSLYTLSNVDGRYHFKDNKKGIETEDYADHAIEAIERSLQVATFDTPTIWEKFVGWFGFTTFDMVGEFENINLSKKEVEETPLLRYDFFKYVLVFDHFYESLYIIECLDEDEDSGIDDILGIISRQDHQTYSFHTHGDIKSTMTEEYYKSLVTTAKAHCQRGDVFQLVLSRRFSQEFSGDEFNVYRALRSINPSPYLFYFDYTTYKIFGSSPETQITTENGIAEVHPIAGTFKRSGDDRRDTVSAKELLNDPKENAEHTMLVDLARNDLSKNCRDVKVVSYKEVQYFSHVIHLVSKVQGRIPKGVLPYQIFADTFPAGTLSGAPKNMALRLIDTYEPHNRLTYGGGIGIIKTNGDINHAIVIRSFYCKDNILNWQSGAGIVIGSKPENESQEVYNKLGALQKAIELAKEL